MVGQTKHRTQDDEARIEAILEIGCIPCAVLGWPCVPCQVNHLLIGGERHEDEHRYTDGECPWHHAGHPVPPHCCGSIEEASRCHGPSRRHNSKDFHERFGSDEQLLAIEDALIRIRASAARRGEYLTPRQYVKLTRLLHGEVVLGRPPTPDDLAKLGRAA